MIQILSPVRLILFLYLFLTAYLSEAQNPSLQILRPGSDTINTRQHRNYISGNTCSSCTLTINDNPVKVWSTGAFAISLDLREGDTIFHLKSTDPSGKHTEHRLLYNMRLAEPEKEEQEFKISSVKISPSGENWLMPGDRIEIEIKAQPGNEIRINNRYPAFERPRSETGGLGGKYYFTHLIEENDPLVQRNILITMKNEQNEMVSHELESKIKVLDPDLPLIGKTRDTLPFLEFGRGTDRLGGAKINYVDTAILLHITGKSENRYRIQLAPGHSAYIPEYQVELLAQGNSIPHSLTGSWSVWGDDVYDYVSVRLDERLPYTTFQDVDPARIIVDLYGATANTNWITQLKTAKEVKAVDYEQRSDGILRLIISLKHQTHWGYSVYYQGKSLTIRVKRPPAKLKLSGMVIAVDAGHGGAHPGAIGATGAMEKNITLEIARKLAETLKRSGVEVIMTRDSDVTKSMHDRILMLQKEEPDLLISIHCNSSSNPVQIQGTSTYYRYIGFRPLSETILDRMLALGFHNFGNIGRFNFSLNGPTEYPNVLVETLFISHPEDEMKLLDPSFQKKMAKAMKRGVKDFLKDARRK